jgi:hypothetical protein
MVQWWPEQGQGVSDLVLIGCARGLDAQAESWRLQDHIDSGCQKEALFGPKRVACPGSRADSAVKIRYVVPCGLALTASQPLGKHDTGPGYSLCGWVRSVEPELCELHRSALRQAAVGGDSEEDAAHSVLISGGTPEVVVACAAEQVTQQ